MCSGDAQVFGGNINVAGIAAAAERVGVDLAEISDIDPCGCDIDIAGITGGVIVEAGPDGSAVIEQDMVGGDRDVGRADRVQADYCQLHSLKLQGCRHR